MVDLAPGLFMTVFTGFSVVNVHPIWRHTWKLSVPSTSPAKKVGVTIIIVELQLVYMLINYCCY